MTEERLVLAELLEKAGDGDFLRAAAEAVLAIADEEKALIAGTRRPGSVACRPGRSTI